MSERRFRHTSRVYRRALLAIVVNDVMSDHVQLFVRVRSTAAAAAMIRQCSGHTARVLRRKVPQPGATRRRCGRLLRRRLGRRPLGVDGAPLHRAPLRSGDGVMRRSYVFRLHPTARQTIALATCVESHRELYNAALQERRDAWAHSKTRVFRGPVAQPTEFRSARPIKRCGLFGSAAGHAAPPQYGVSPGSSAAPPPGRNLATRDSRGGHGSTVWSGPKTATARAGYPKSGGCTCKASDGSRSTCTGRCRDE